ncbi:TPA: BLUF domain-containing protein [Enterobacter roggenkampii]|nr:BLUF domain-containing protein [Enterobacter roggenkampii]
MIEGSESAVDSIFRKIRSDLRHTEIVELMRDYSSRRFLIVLVWSIMISAVIKIVLDIKSMIWPKNFG